MEKVHRVSMRALFILPHSSNLHFFSNEVLDSSRLGLFILLCFYATLRLLKTGMPIKSFPTALSLLQRGQVRSKSTTFFGCFGLSGDQALLWGCLRGPDTSLLISISSFSLA